MIAQRIAAWSRGHSSSELTREAQRRNIPASAVSTLEDVLRDEQLLARGFYVDEEFGDLGVHSVPVGAIAITRDVRLGPAPKLGQHNAELLAELGMSQRDHESLVASGVM
jgi:crotonobetainyl-CoA:carnitine CoA-transferase CaiB-like acyl-CoA transferase